MDERIKKYLRGHRALVLYALGQTPSYVEELSGALRISQPAVKKIIAVLLKSGLIEQLDRNRIPFDLFPLVYEKCNKLNSHDPLVALDSLDFYTITNRGRKYLGHTKRFMFTNGGGNRERK